MTRAPSLDRIVRQAGAVYSSQGGEPVISHYGSAAGELAVCIRGVGLVDRSDLSILAIDGSPADLDRVTTLLAGRELAVGGAIHAGGTWWCRSQAAELLAVSRREEASRVQAQAKVVQRRLPTLVVVDRTEQFAAIGLIGDHADAVLAELGAYGGTNDPRAATPFSHARLGTVDVAWLLESDHSALALVAASDAATAWRVIEDAGRPRGLSYVGREAADRYAVHDRGGRLRLHASP